MWTKLASVLILLAGCGQPPVSDPVPPAGDDSCGASQYAALVGQDATVLERQLIMGPVRVIRPGMAVTMDYSPTRINFAVDAANRISGVTCG